MTKANEPRFEIVHEGKVLGWTYFEFGDPPLGVAFGKLHPVIEFSGWELPTNPDKVPLSARTAEGSALTPCSQVYLDGIPEELEVSICGLHGDVYRRFFGHHVESYEQRFRDES